MSGPGQNLSSWPLVGDVWSQVQSRRNWLSGPILEASGRNPSVTAHAAGYRLRAE
jgi:hypothetical protein